MNRYLSIFLAGFCLLTAIYLQTGYCSSKNKGYEYLRSLNKIPNDSYILVHTLSGEVLCVHRRSGFVKWRLHSASALRASYNNGPVLVVDPVSGSLYEYASAVSDFLFQQLEHSIMGHVRRSPAYYRNFLSLGSKSDFWISVDMNTGKIIESVFQDYVDKCPTSLNSGNMNTLQNSTKQQVDIINLGRTQYNLVLRDRFTGSVKLNITYNTFATHTEADLQNYDLQHVAITQPALLTFEGPKLIWSLPLSSPVIGMYAVWSPSSDSSSSLHNNNMPNAQMHEEAPSYGDPSDDEVVTTTFQDSIITESNENNKKNNVNDNNSNRPSQKEVVQLPRVLRRIAFTTYALDLRNISSFPEDRIYDEIEAKFSGTLDLAPSLYIGRSKSAPVYALLCVAEATLRLRGLRRASEMYMLEGPKNLIVVNNSQQETTTESDSSSGTNRTDDNWPTGLIGLYEMPPSYNRAWDNNEMDDQFMPMRKRGNRLKRLSSLSSDASTMWAIIVPPPSPLASPTETVNTSEITVSQDSAVIDTHKNTNDSSHAEDSHLNHRPLSNSRWLLWSTSLLCTILCIITVWILFLSFFTKSRKTYSTIQHTKYFEVVHTIFSKLFILHHNKNLNFSTSTHTEKTNLSTEMHLTIPGFLPPHFDTPDSSGWAGCSAQEAGQPEPIRINLNEVLGHGANGTMVFAGTYGPHETAVKRIVRHPLLEKHWRREHAILLRHQHPHLVRCYWTGSTANFHYLVMQRCALSLNEALSRSTRAPPPSSSDCTNPTNPTKTSLLDDLGLTPVEIIHQFISAVACLHRNHIVHRDLKPSNILIVMNDNHNSTNTGDNNNSSEKARIVVGDFGLSRPLSTDERQQPHDATLNSFGPHISMKIQQMKSRSSGHTSNNSISSDRYNSVGSAEINDHNTSNDVYGICVRYHNQKEHNPTTTTIDNNDVKNIGSNGCVSVGGDINSRESDNSVCFTFGTLGWMAPELCDMESAKQVTCAIDIFACGLLAFYVLTHGKHPYDPYDKEFTNEYHTENSIQSSAISISSSTSSSSVTNSSSIGNEIQSFRCTLLSRQHERQLAIAERCQPNLDILTDNPTNVCESYLSRYLIQTMLSSNPNDRPTAEEITYYPLFWSPNKVIRFISELSDVMDIRDHSFDRSLQKTFITSNSSTDEGVSDCIKESKDTDNITNQNNNPTNMKTNLTPPQIQRLTRKCFNKYHHQQMLYDLDRYTNWVFNKHWFARLEPELVNDLLSTRGYQDTSLLYLLRAIRNKRNHIWSLPDNIRAILGYSQEGMATYWTNRFPALLPIIYGLCNKHFTGNANFSEFLPPKSICKVFIGAPVNCLWWPIWNTDDNCKTNEKLDEQGDKVNIHTYRCSSSGRQPTKSDLTGWKRGEVVLAYSEELYKEYDRPPDVMKKFNTISEKNRQQQRDMSLDVDSNDAITITNNSNHRRRRPNQPKKTRPCKKRISIQRRENLLALAGSELSST